MTTLIESRDPATGGLVWSGPAASAGECAAAVDSARRALDGWSATTIDERIALVRRYRDALQEDADAIATAIARETGKPFWETKTEVASMMGGQ